ncbi:MAG: NRDE family protein [Desulfobacterales bacterium]|nr:NRDE family protein [Desulfobacterales bacterium]
MCLILFAIDLSDEFPFILAANRDEFYARPTQPMGFWPDTPDLLAGKDLEAGGTWFGVSTSGRFAALTNYRDLSQIKSNAPSRGELIPQVLSFKGPVEDYLSSLKKNSDRYSGFNLLAGETDGPVFCFSNQSKGFVEVPPGIHGLSNHLLDTPWPKIKKGRKEFERILTADPMDNKGIFAMLADKNKPKDDQLPDTGVGLEWERILSPLFIQSDTYGTRSSTLMRINCDYEIEIIERTHVIGSENGTEDRIFALAP